MDAIHALCTSTTIIRPTNLMLLESNYLVGPKVVSLRNGFCQPFLSNNRLSLSLSPSQSSTFRRSGASDTTHALPSTADLICHPNHQWNNDGFLEIEMEVRHYELDQYGVVNNAVYSSYCQYAHHKLLSSIVLDAHIFESNCGSLALSKLSLNFLAPLKNRDKFVLKVRVSATSTVRLFFEHYIYKWPHLEPILEAKAVMVFIDEKHRPTRLPATLKSLFKQPMNN